MASARRATAAETRRARSSDKPRLEWLLGGLGFVLLAVAVSFLLYEGLTNNDGPGAIRTTVTETREVDDAYIVRFTIHNDGDETLAQLHLTGRLMEEGTEVEAARAIIDYLPGHSRKEGGFYFRSDPRRYELDITPEGYSAP